jgi:hypothetical protein
MENKETYICKESKTEKRHMVDIPCRNKKCKPCAEHRVEIMKELEARGPTPPIVEGIEPKDCKCGEKTNGKFYPTHERLLSMSYPMSGYIQCDHCKRLAWTYYNDGSGNIPEGTLNVGGEIKTEYL